MKLLKQAQANAERENISITEAVLRIIESEGNSDTVEKAFSQSPASAPDAEWPDYGAA
jgi:hypothetical protein